MAPEKQNDPQPLPAASARVTPEELARAVARIEARQAEQARQQEATIPIGQAVEELGINVAPEEILAEVQAQRGQPPMPVPPPGATIEVANCPACGRKLLTRTSALCNWCGARIDNPDYQAQAEAQRQALDQTERTQVEIMAQEEARYGVFGRLKRRAKLSQGPKPGLG